MTVHFFSGVVYTENGAVAQFEAEHQKGIPAFRLDAKQLKIRMSDRLVGKQDINEEQKALSALAREGPWL